MTLLTDCLASLPSDHPATDPGPPYLFVDLYPYDLDDPRTPGLDDPSWEQAFKEPRLHGAILKAWDGVAYKQENADWFVRNFKLLTAMLGDARGVNRFIGGYLYAQFSRDPIKQADLYLGTLEKAGWEPGKDIVPIIDVEGGGERAANRKASADQVVDCVSCIADAIKHHTGTGVMLYGRGLMRDLSIESRMGCDRVWDPSYTERIVLNGLTGYLPNGKKAPWDLADVKLWQYGGDGAGDADVHHLPLSLTGLGKVDVSVFIAGSEKPALTHVRRGLL